MPTSHPAEYDDDDGDTGDEDDEEDDMADEDDEDDEALDASGKVCQCPTCAQERDKKREHAAKTREIEKRLHAAKKQIVMGTNATRYTKTVLPEAQRKMKDGVLMYRDNYLVAITAMNIYNHKSTEELRWEDYYLKNNDLKVIRNQLAVELADRERERAEASHMEREESAMRLWSSAADDAWKKFQRGLEVCNKGTAESRAAARELFSLSLQTCISGPHAIQCYYHRALCNRTENPSQAISDCRVVLNLKKDQALAHYLLGTLMLANPQHDNENQYERAQHHLEQALERDPSIFQGNPDRLAELTLAREKAAHQRLVNAAEEKKNLGNAALQKGAFAEAEALYSAAFQICPNGEKSYIYLCNRATAKSEMALRKSNKTEEYESLQSAIQDCDTSLAMNSTYTKALFRRAFCLGMCKFLKDDYAAALAFYNEALDFDKNSVVVKQEIKRVTATIDAIKAREVAKALERDMAEKEALKAEARERERKNLDEKRAKEEQARKDKAEKIAQEKAEQVALKKEREAAKAEKEKELAAEKERDKERLKAEKETEKIAREQEKLEERERRKLEREIDKERSRLEKERLEKAYLENERMKREKQAEFAKEMSRVSERIKETEKSGGGPSTQSVSTSSIVAAITAVSSASAGDKSRSADKDAGAAKPASSASVAPPSGKAMSAIESVVTSMGSRAERKPAPEPVAPAKAVQPPPAPDSKAQISKNITSVIECPEDRVGIVIGSNGSVIKSIIKKTACNMHIDLEGKGPKRVVMTGTVEQIDMAKRYVNAVIVHGPSVLTMATLPPVDASFDKKGGDGGGGKAYAALMPSDFDFEETDCCLICADVMKEGTDRIPCFGQCNHRGACSICLMRMRAIEPKDLCCPMCRQKNEHIICSFEDKPWKEFKLPGSVPSGIRFHRESQMYFPVHYYARHIEPLWLQACKVCSVAFKDSEQLGKHYQTVHNLRLCQLCIKYKQVFPSEQIVYTVAELDSHMKHRGKDGSEGHPHCSYCNTEYYDKTLLLKHITTDHFMCPLCPRDDLNSSYYRDYKMLDAHYRENHFACEDPACVEKKHVVFRSLFDLQAHNRTAHTVRKAGSTEKGAEDMSAFPALGGGAGGVGANPNPNPNPNPNRALGASRSSSSTNGTSASAPAFTPMLQLEMTALTAPQARASPHVLAASVADKNAAAQGEPPGFFGISVGSNASTLGAGLGLSSLASRLGAASLSDSAGGDAGLDYGFSLGSGFGSLGGIAAPPPLQDESAFSVLLSRPAPANRELVGLFGGGGFDAPDHSQFGSTFFEGFGLGPEGGGGLGVHSLGSRQGTFESDSLLQRIMGDSLMGGMGSSTLGAGLYGNNGQKTSFDGLDALGDDYGGPYDDDDSEPLGAKSFPPLTIDRIIQLLKIFGSEGILGSALPELFHKKYGEKLRMDTKYGKRVKLLDMVEGHPNVRLTGEKSGSMKLYYKEPGVGGKVGGGKPGAAAVAAVVAAASASVAGNGGSAESTLSAAIAQELPPPPYTGEPGIEVDLLSLPEAMLICDALTWLRDYDMHVYRWAGNPQEWTEFAIRLRPDVIECFESPASPTHVAALMVESGCEMSVETEKLYGKQEKFLRFVRGITGSPSNAAMASAIVLVSGIVLDRMVSADDMMAMADEEGELVEADMGGVPPALSLLEAPGRVQQVLDIPPSAVGHVYGKNGKKLNLMRKKSGAYITLVPMKSMKGKGPAKMTISGSLSAVDLVARMVKAALAGTSDMSLVGN